MFQYSTIEIAHMLSSALVCAMVFILYNDIFYKIECSLKIMEKEKKQVEQNTNIDEEKIKTI